MAIGKRNDNYSLPEEFKINNNSVTDTPIIANHFNEYFANIGPKTYQNILRSSSQILLQVPVSRLK